MGLRGVGCPSDRAYHFAAAENKSTEPLLSVFRACLLDQVRHASPTGAAARQAP